MKALSALTRIGLVAALLVFASTMVSAQVNDMAVNKAKEFIGLLQKGDYNSAYQKVDSNLGFKLTPEKLGAIWQNLTTKTGSVQEFKEAKVENVSGYMVVTQVVKFEKGHVDIKIALDNSLRVADMRFVNHEAQKAQAQAQPQQAEAPATPAA